MCQCYSRRQLEYLDYFSLLVSTREWRLTSEMAQMMYSWCMICEWCTARQLLYCTYLRSLVYACKYIYGTLKIRLPLKKYHACYNVDIIMTNVTMEGLFFFGSSFLLMSNVVDSLHCRYNHQKVFWICDNSILDTTMPRIKKTFTSWTNHELRHQWFLRANMCLSNTSSSYSCSVRLVCGNSRVVNKLSAYEFSMYGTRYGGSIPASNHLDVLLILMFS